MNTLRWRFVFLTIKHGRGLESLKKFDFIEEEWITLSNIYENGNLGLSIDICIAAVAKYPLSSKLAKHAMMNSLINGNYHIDERISDMKKALKMETDTYDYVSGSLLISHYLKRGHQRSHKSGTWNKVALRRAKHRRALGIYDKAEKEIETFFSNLDL